MLIVKVFAKILESQFIYSSFRPYYREALILYLHSNKLSYIDVKNQQEISFDVDVGTFDYHNQNLNNIATINPLTTNQNQTYLKNGLTNLKSIFLKVIVPKSLAKVFWK